MQRYAEEAQREWMMELQTEFNRAVRNRDFFKGNEKLIEAGMKRSDRYRWLKDEGKSEEEIIKDFNTPVQMALFSWKGKNFSVDTMMTPLDSIKYNKMVLRNAMMSMEPHTGYVRAWVGGINFEHYKYDQVKMGTRQVGSTAKPFTYAVAADNGYSPCFLVPNQPISIGDWSPRGENSLPGPITLRKALANSQNYATADLMNRVGPEAVATLTKRMGITTDVPPYPSICLGVFDASVYDMTGSYAAFVNHGVWTEPQYLMRVEDRNGVIIYEHKPTIKVVLNEQTAYVMVDMLKAVVDGGSGGRIRWKYKLTQPIGGKTGTTQGNADAWFVGITPKLVTGVWTGAEDRSISFANTAQGQGAHSALPVFALYMQKVYKDPQLEYAQGDFELPKGGLRVELDCNQYHQPQYDEPERRLDDRLGF